jgi:hypothetical protein
VTNKLTPTDIGDLANDLDAGKFGEKVAALISEIAAATADQEVNLNNQEGKLTLTLGFKKSGTNSVQLTVTHKIDAKIPTPFGHLNDVETKSTIMVVNPSGRVSFFLENQSHMFDAKGEPAN